MLDRPMSQSVESRKKVQFVGHLIKVNSADIVTLVIIRATGLPKVAFTERLIHIDLETEELKSSNGSFVDPGIDDNVVTKDSEVSMKVTAWADGY